VVAYEILLMLDAELAEPRQTEIIDRVKTLVEKGGGSWQQQVPWGKRRLAYEIAHKDEGIYHLLTFDAEPATVEEIGRVLKIDDSVMRHMAVRRVEGSSTAPPAILAPEPPRQSAASETRRPVGAVAPTAAEPETPAAEPEAPAAASEAPAPAAEPEEAPAAEPEAEAESVQAAE
jgi:small subunit ribosomal protein S6